jgi:2-amino-4-hydroxy-6-hydroxymethyldihydropteridine diphosphokinase
LLEYQITCYLGLGANKGDKTANLRLALDTINKRAGITLLRQSSVYESVPVGVSRQPDFYNCVAEIRTGLEPHLLLKAIKGIEYELGREPNSHLLPRPIDIDILLYGDLEVDSLDLMIPHSRLTKRAFVLIPLLELNPELIHPISREPLKGYLDAIQPPQTVKKVMDAGQLFERTEEN